MSLPRGYLQLLSPWIRMAKSEYAWILSHSTKHSSKTITLCQQSKMCLSTSRMQDASQSWTQKKLVLACNPERIKQLRNYIWYSLGKVSVVQNAIWHITCSLGIPAQTWPSTVGPRRMQCDCWRYSRVWLRRNRWRNCKGSWQKPHWLLERCRNKGIKLNSKKLRQRRKEVSYTGHVLSADGLKPDHDKLKQSERCQHPRTNRVSNVSWEWRTTYISMCPSCQRLPPHYVNSSRVTQNSSGTKTFMALPRWSKEDHLKYTSPEILQPKHSTCIAVQCLYARPGSMLSAGRPTCWHLDHWLLLRFNMPKLKSSCWP